MRSIYDLLGIPPEERFFANCYTRDYPHPYLEGMIVKTTAKLCWETDHAIEWFWLSAYLVVMCTLWPMLPQMIVAFYNARTTMLLVLSFGRVRLPWERVGKGRMPGRRPMNPLLVAGGTLTAWLAWHFSVNENCAVMGFIAFVIYAIKLARVACTFVLWVCREHDAMVTAMAVPEAGQPTQQVTEGSTGRAPGQTKEQTAVVQAAMVQATATTAIAMSQQHRALVALRQDVTGSSAASARDGAREGTVQTGNEPYIVASTSKTDTGLGKEYQNVV